ncbi:MAG: class I SAM-dependent methyltransferase [Desulfomonilaceae bacterium]
MLQTPANNLMNHIKKAVLDPSQAKDISYTLRRYYVDQFHLKVFTDPKVRGGLILDLGGNKRSKRGLFDIGCFSGSVIYSNLSLDKSPDVLNDAEYLPFNAQVFDSVICSELLEHLYNPRRALGEIHRVLKPRGTLLICVPFMVGIHGDPHDYGRYTDSFWRKSLDEIGFREIEIEFQGSFFSVMFDMLRSKIYGLIAHWGKERKISISIIGRILGLLKAKAIELDYKTNHELTSKAPSVTTGFGIRATKK